MKKKYHWIGFDGWRYQPQDSLDITICHLYRMGYKIPEIEMILNITTRIAKRAYIFCEPIHRNRKYETEWVERARRNN
jgi:hypothetical protein